ncbi:hypothetical protein Hanom_Chr05g00404471 [Helianthus anomalus]
MLFIPLSHHTLICFGLISVDPTINHICFGLISVDPTINLEGIYGSSQLFNFPPIFFQEYHRFPYNNLFLQWIYIYRWFYILHLLHLRLLFLQSISEFHISLYKPLIDIAESSSSFREPWFLRLMNVADGVILVNHNLLHNFCFLLIKYSLLLLCCFYI